MFRQIATATKAETQGGPGGTEVHARCWSTDDVEPGQSRAYWSKAVCYALRELKVDSPERSKFDGWVAIHPFGPVGLNFFGGDPWLGWRTPEAIARASHNPSFFLTHIRKGELHFEQRGRVAVISPGECVLIDSKAPYQLSFPRGGDILSVEIPRDWLRLWLPEPEDVVAQNLATRSNWGTTLASALGNLTKDRLEDLALPCEVVAEQIAALLALSLGQSPAPATTHQNAVLRRVESTMRDRFCDPSLDPAAIAKEHGLSKRSLHMLFAAAGTTFGRAVMKLRLEKSKRLLDDRRFDRVSIGELACRCGFTEPSHFARRFRARYGAAPAAYRAVLRC